MITYSFREGVLWLLARVYSSAIYGIEGYIVEVEADISPSGMPFFGIVGLPDKAVQESRERVRAAIRNSGLFFPGGNRIVINLAPADVKKEGPGLDLPIALGILSATEQLLAPDLEDWVFLGELALDGSVRPVNGVLPIALAARQAGKKYLAVPTDNAPEAAVVNSMKVYAVQSLGELVQLLQNPQERKPVPPIAVENLLSDPCYEADFSDVKGQEHAKRALEVAAAGAHNVIMIGPPGSGKTMLARRIPGILPPMTLEEALEVTKLYSVIGRLPAKASLITTRPFRSPHHTVSNAGLIGGGSIPQPGEVSLAHHGVLFLDELPEFKRDVLEVLRQPLEDGVVTISRAAGSLSYPAQFILVGAMNPCPCGFLTDPSKNCTCSPSAIQRYLMRISGPLLDRIDLHIEVPRLKQEELLGKPSSSSSAETRQRVTQARQKQQKRFRGLGIFANGQMKSRHIREFCKVDSQGMALLRTAVQQLNLSARAYDRILKVARTIADLAGCEEIEVNHIAEAIQYRSMDRRLWL